MSSSMPDGDRRLYLQAAARWTVMGIAAVAALWAWSTGRLAELDLEGIRALVDASGAWGPAVYVLSFTFLQPMGLSAHLFIVAAGVVWPVSTALVCSQLGLFGGTVMSHVLGQCLAPESLRRRLPARVLEWEQRLKSGGLRAVIVVRLLFFSFFPISAMMGAIRVPWRPYLLGTIIGCLPVAVGEVLLAHELVSWVDDADHGADGRSSSVSD